MTHNDCCMCPALAETGEEVSSRPVEYVSMKSIADLIDKLLKDFDGDAEIPEDDTEWESTSDMSMGEFHEFCDMDMAWEDEFLLDSPNEMSCDDFDEALKCDAK